MTVTEERPAAVLGQRLLRREDPALLTGEAKYTNDLNVPGALHLAVLRSPYAHARITSADVSGAVGLPAGAAAATGADRAAGRAAARRGGRPSVGGSGAVGMPGVVAAYTGADLADAWAAPMPCAWPVTDD